MLRFLLFASLVACSLGADPPRRPLLDGRVVGGRLVTAEEFPYQVSYESGVAHFCGASIISPDWVVTAAHCFDGAVLTSSRFRAGSNISEALGTVHPAAQIVQHPLYDYWTIDYDIAVARVSKPFTYGTAVQPISLTSSEPAAGSLAVVSGWAAAIHGEWLRTQLQTVEVEITSRAECDSAYADYDGITENMVCAGVPSGGTSRCVGDSGGPLVVGGQLVGIVSWGIGCRGSQYPVVYSNIATLKSFVTEQTGVQ